MSLEIETCRLRWLGHILSMRNEGISKVPLRTPTNHLAEDNDEETERGGSLVRKWRPTHRTGYSGGICLRRYIPTGMKRISKSRREGNSHI